VPSAPRPASCSTTATRRCTAPRGWTCRCSYTRATERRPARGFPVSGTFTHRQLIDDDLEVIPTPGHTPGTTSYLWDSGTHRFLFTGDSLWVEYGEWKAVVLGSSDRAASLHSLRLISDLDFDVLVPWAAMKGEPSVNVVNHDDARTRIDAVIARVEAGGGY